MIKIFIGYDPREAVAYSVASFSIQKRASTPVFIAPIHNGQLRDVFNRPAHALASTSFSFSRFLTPYLCQYEGWAIFMDGDVLCRDDIAKLWALRDEKYAVMVVKHDHQPVTSVKFLGSTQTAYPKKNWSSVMMMNCSRCKALTKEYVNTATGLELHQFKWLESEELIGELPRDWNYLVDYYKYSDEAKLVHFTEGGPYFPDFSQVDYADEWYSEYSIMNAADTAPVQIYKVR